jgi:hypothetical protein
MQQGFHRAGIGAGRESAVKSEFLPVAARAERGSVPGYTAPAGCADHSLDRIIVKAVFAYSADPRVDQIDQGFKEIHGSLEKYITIITMKAVFVKGEIIRY